MKYYDNVNAIQMMLDGKIMTRKSYPNKYYRISFERGRFCSRDWGSNPPLATNINHILYMNNEPDWYEWTEPKFFTIEDQRTEYHLKCPKCGDKNWYGNLDSYTCVACGFEGTKR